MQDDAPYTQRKVDGLFIVAVLTVLYTLVRAYHGVRHAVPVFAFDDAFMFHRYARNVLHGSGISWNPGGPHTFGLTSPLWLVPVLVGSLLPRVSSTVLLVSLSSLSALLAILTLAVVCSRRAKAAILQKPALLFGMLGVWFYSTPAFRECSTNGMETMLAMALIALFTGASLELAERPSRAAAVALAFLGLLEMTARPEAGIVVILLPLLTFSRNKKAALYWKTFLPTFAALLICYLAFNYLYYGSAVPLPMFIKAAGGYKGFAYFPNPIEFFVAFLVAALPFIAVLVAFGERKQASGACIAVALLVFCYLFTVLQIMGDNGRYFMPYLPLLVVPAIAALDRWLQAPAGAMLSWRRLLALSFLVVLANPGPSQALERAYNLHQMRGKVWYKEPVPVMAARQSLPQYTWDEMNKGFAHFVSDLPGTPSIALTEAGIVGDAAARSSILDLAGLNDKHIAFHGASVDDILSRNVDIIWMPDGAYTWLRGALVSDPRFLQQYDFYAGAFDYGIAIRKASPYTAEIQAHLLNVWPRYYPRTSMADYKVSAMLWDSQPQVIR